MIGICPDKLKAFALASNLNIFAIKRGHTKFEEKILTYLVTEAILRPRSPLKPKAKAIIFGESFETLKYADNFDWHVSAYDRLRVMREHVKHMKGYVVPNSVELAAMYNNMSIPAYPMKSISQLPTDEQRAILITSGIAEADPCYDHTKELVEGEHHPTIKIALKVLGELIDNATTPEHAGVYNAARTRVITDGILRPHKAVSGYMFRALRASEESTKLKAAREFSRYANGHDLAKVMAIQITMVGGYYTPMNRTHSTAELMVVNYDVADYLTTPYPITNLELKPTKAQLDWQVKFGYAKQR